MQTNYSPMLKKVLGIVAALFGVCYAQVPTANFSISPNPVCSGSTVQITDMSTGNPTSWSYTIASPNSVLTSQNPTLLATGVQIKTITLIASNGTGTSAPVVQQLTINALPSSVINPTTSSMCFGGQPFTFTATGSGYTYSWSTGATTSTLTVAPQTTTSYSVLVTTNLGCSITRTITLNVGTTVSISANPLTICLGNTSTLTATGGGFGPFTYSWSTGASTKTISTNLTGIYTVTYTNGEGCTASQSYTMVSSNTLSLTPKASPTVVCSGITSALSVTGASNYTWSTGPTSSLIGVTPTTTTTYTVIGASGTCTGSAFITVSVNVNPTVTAASSSVGLCPGKSATLTVGGAVNYTWSTGGTTSVIVVTPSANTSYTLKGTNPGCPGTSSIVITVTVNFIPILQIGASKSVACVGDKLNFSAYGAISYTWSTGATSSLISVTHSATTTYSVSGTDVNGCEGSAVYTQTVKVCTGISVPGDDPEFLQIYPVPAKEVSISSNEDLEIMLIDQLGQLLRRYSFQKQHPLHIRDLSPGLYYIVGQKDGIGITRRFVITGE